MSNINVRKTETPARPASPSYYDPLSFARQFFGWDPFREMAPLARAEGQDFFPAFEVKETPEGYVFKADVPGVKEGDLEITLTGNRLNVAGKREAEKQERSDTFFTYERSYGSFSRLFTLPQTAAADRARADLKDGVLTVMVPRTPETQPKKIEVKK